VIRDPVAFRTMVNALAADSDCPASLDAAAGDASWAAARIASIANGHERHFPADTVVPLAQVRHLVIDFVMHGERPAAVPRQQQDHLVA